MSNSKFDWTFWTTFALALVGALAWLQPLVFSLFQEVEINGKILSNDANIGSIPNHSDHQTIYFQKVAIFSKNKDFFPRDIKVFVKYPSISNELTCILWTWKELIFTFQEQGQNIRKKLNINQSDYLIQSIVFPKNETKVGYVSFSVDFKKDEMFEYVRYEFEDFNGNKKGITFSEKDIEANKLIHDSNIWVDL
ncbi:MAG: hypothetical protein Q8861_14100 [Bacteroidota bacterium]|nr:hypothetical protein [Bacteroidota bacterium]